MEDDLKRARIFGSIVGWAAGIITGVLLMNYIIFPAIAEVTLTEALRLLLQQFH